MAQAPGTTNTDVFSPTMQRLAAASGIGFFVLIILTFLFSGEETPDWAAPGSEYVQFNSENVDDVQLGSLFFLLASLELLWFAGYLRSELGRFEGAVRGFTRASHIAFGGGVVAVVGLALTAIMSVVAVSQPDGTSGDVVRALHHISFATWAIASVGLSVMFTAASLLALRTAVLPSWLGWVGLVAGLCQFLLLFIVLKPEDDEFWVGFAWVPGFLGLMIWILGASIVFLRRVGQADVPVERRPT
jgi:Domain of unknown function (DUF4386)